MKALFTYDYGKEKMETIKELGYDLIYIHEKQLSQVNGIKDIDILVCYDPFKSIDISKLSSLKWIQLSSVGIDQAPVDYIRKSGIILTNNRGGYSIPMGEWIVLKILEIYKDSKYFYEKQKEANWKINMELLELYGKTVGFLGTGTISSEGAKRLQGFGTNVIGLNTDGRDVKYFDKCFSQEKINEFLSRCDIVVCAMPYTNETHHLIDKEKLGNMRDKSVFINVSRGSLVDEMALIEKIKENKFLGVALDVFEKEPLSNDNPLWKFKNVYATPHNSWVSEVRNQRKFHLMFENMKRYKEGKTLLNIVNLNKGY